ncbi:hypothetical protein FOZ61_010156 [Perkinsus olseni]|uniref:Uncharacterized protein n=1 Tax=Perkinsus olseni TaxID=32597 RepID=A0A7J6MGE1_PEROL|nr:hypothetical protein FOZ61_010156 [Perkinsus olseni]KAF4675987.1 hypothetical protein FOL46_008598 [Perkinsus olseni]
MYNDNVTRESLPRGFSPQPLPPKLHLIDSGTSDVPRDIFDAFIRNLKATVAAFDPTDAKVHENILWEGDDLPVQLIRPSHVKFLPTIIYSVVAEGGDIVNIKISPEHYVGSCSEARCAVYISVTERTLVCLGQPFFRAYITHVDLEEKLLSVKSKITTSQSLSCAPAAERNDTDRIIVVVYLHRTKFGFYELIVCERSLGWKEHIIRLREFGVD